MVRKRGRGGKGVKEGKGVKDRKGKSNNNRNNANSSQSRPEFIPPVRHRGKKTRKEKEGEAGEEIKKNGRSITIRR